MIRITRTECSITIEGHAGYEEKGKDIVCAAVSTLIQTMVATIEQKEPEAIEYKLTPGDSEVFITHPSELTKTLIDAFFIGVNEIADSHPDYVKIVQA